MTYWLVGKSDLNEKPVELFIWYLSLLALVHLKLFTHFTLYKFCQRHWLNKQAEAELGQNSGWGLDWMIVKIDDKNKNSLTKIPHWNRNSSLWLIFIPVMEIHHSDENISLWWKFITGMKIYYYIENSSLWWKFITVMKFITMIKYITVIKIHHCDRNLSLWWNSSLE